MSYPGWNKQMSLYGAGENLHGYPSPENKQYVLSRRPVPPVPTSQHLADSHSNAPMSLPPNQHLSSPTNPRPPPKQHSSRATFFIQNSSSCGHIAEGARDRTPISLPNDFSLPESISEPNLSGQANYPPSTAAQIGSSSVPQMNLHSHQQMNDNMTPLFVRMDPTDSNSVNSPNYNSYLPSDSGQASDSTLNTRYLNMNFDNEVSRLGGAVNPPSYIYPASNFVTLDGTSHADNGEQMFINHPPVPNRCSVPGHPPVFTRTSSGDSDRRSNLSSGDERHVSTHIVFPSGVPSDSSSVSSESSKRLSSGSMQEEAAYTTALLQFQRDKMEKLKKDLENELRKLSKTRSEVNQMDKNMLERQRNRYSTFPSVEDVSKLREINRRLQTDIQVMTREIDMFENGQTPLGILDPLEQQNFYKNMNTGQHGSIYSRPPPQTPSRETPPPIPPRTPITSTTVIPPAPPPQPQQDSDGDGEPWNCSACTFLNHPALNKCECCEMPRLNNAPQETGRVRHKCQNDLCYCHDK
ncbi:hypothetical protein FSP39_001814 [Pinctada imbricata]|uniref:RanBP2-type domain-containing protein n=1 Tax=Pinctada imbricata TaxID=66713 RepID=A0AA88Y280_PINIB|nr:hypothetical protein FSP39_001814 [Pinctada imbricata]